MVLLIRLWLSLLCIILEFLTKYSNEICAIVHKFTAAALELDDTALPQFSDPKTKTQNPLVINFFQMLKCSAGNFEYFSVAV